MVCLHADGVVRSANACTPPELLWALNEGGGSVGVVTRLTRSTLALPAYCGRVFGVITAPADTAFCALLAHPIGVYHARLCNPHWDEYRRCGPDNIGTGKYRGCWAEGREVLVAALHDALVDVQCSRCVYTERRDAASYAEQTQDYRTTITG